MTVPFVSPEQFAQGQATGRTTQALDGKESKIRQLLEAQKVAMNDMVNGKLSTSVRFCAARTWDILEERIRILRGKVKPGSRNVSVRELSPMEQKRIAAPRVRTNAVDYLADAAEQLRRAQSAHHAPPADPQNPTK